MICSVQFETTQGRGDRLWNIQMKFKLKFDILARLPLLVGLMLQRIDIYCSFLIFAYVINVYMKNNGLCLPWLQKSHEINISHGYMKIL